MRNVQFTNDWFQLNRLEWEQHLLPFKDKEIKAIEIGVFEGQATCWLLENVLTNSKSTIDCIDTFEGGVEHQASNVDMEKISKRFEKNICETVGGAEKVHTHIGKSQIILREFKMDKYDIVYIDGSHMAKDVLEDAILSWRLLKVGGILIFDDYLWKQYDDPYSLPKTAINAFLKLYIHDYETLTMSREVIIRKIKQS